MTEKEALEIKKLKEEIKNLRFQRQVEAYKGLILAVGTIIIVLKYFEI